MFCVRGGYFDLDVQKKRLVTLEEQMQATDFWQDPDVAQRVSKKAADLRLEIEGWERLIDELQELKELESLAAQDVDLLQEVEQKHTLLLKQFEKKEFSTLFSGRYDESDVVLTIHAGSGGTEAQDWTAMLLRMYSRYAEAHDWDVRLLEESRADDVGYKRVMIGICGRWAYGHLKGEAGVHRLVRISPFDAEKMRHTTFALVEVIPQFEELEELEIDPSNLRIDTFMASGKGGQSVNTTYSAVRIVHLPTGITVTCQNERSQQQNKQTALSILKAKLELVREQAQAEKIDDLRGNLGKAEWGNQIRSYVLHPYKMVKDHRSNFETADAEGVLEGDLDACIEAYLRSQLST